MAEATVEHAPAKVNLALHVTGRRADGYHTIETLAVFAEAGDAIRARTAERDGFALSGPFAAALKDETGNLVERARDLLRDLAGADLPPVALELEKNLPVASGIGGGSSDAAATLRALVRHWRLDIAPDTLSKAALALGADLPMCLAARSLVARGIGEEIALADGLPPLAMVMANPGVAVSTPAIFRTLEKRDNAPLPPLPAHSGFDDLVGWLGATRNDLEPAAIAQAPSIGETLAALQRNGAAFARMSGSGATCFGLFADGEGASAAAAAIARMRPAWYVRATTSIEKVPADVAD